MESFSMLCICQYVPIHTENTGEYNIKLNKNQVINQPCVYYLKSKVNVFNMVKDINV